MIPWHIQVVKKGGNHKIRPSDFYVITTKIYLVHQLAFAERIRVSCDATVLSNSDLQ